MNSHKLDSQNHSHIIGRKDGVTGDSIKANNTVVFCAACQSVFLKESWEYMNGKHCQQSEMLDFIPQPLPTFFAKKRKKFSFELTGKSSTETVQVVLTTLLGTGFMLTFSKLFQSDYFYIYSISALILSVLGGFVAKTKHFKEILGNNYSKIKVLENGIELKGRDFYSFYEIDYIEYTRKFDSIYKQEGRLIEEYRTPPNHSLYIFLKDKRIIRHKLPNSSSPLEIKDFLFALAWATQFIHINFYTEDKKEQEIIQNIQQKYVGRISILSAPTEV